MANFKVGDVITLEDFFPSTPDLYVVLAIEPRNNIIKLFNLQNNKIDMYMGSWIKKYVKVIKPGD